MNKPAKILCYRCPWLVALLLTLFISACSNASTIGNSAAQATYTPKTPSISRVHLPTGPITYVALGASDAVGVGSNQPGSQGYVPLIAAHLPKGSHLVNLGISGERLHDALTEELPIALSTSPGLITVWLVANDFVDGVSYNAYI